MNNWSGISAFIWSIADMLRGPFKRGHYQDVILPLTVLRRIDCVLEPTRKAVWERAEKLKGKVENLDPQLRKASGFAFYNTSKFSFSLLLDDSQHLASNLRKYIAGFSPNMREVLEKFKFDNTIAELEEHGLLFLVLEKFKNLDLHPDAVTNHQMGYIFEDLIRRFNEALDENPGEHFTPREVIHIMVELLFAEDSAKLKKEQSVPTVYDPCCGSGGMLTIAKETIEQLNPKADVHLFGQEVNPETFAICKSDLFMQSAEGRDAENIKYGSTLREDHHAGRAFNYMLANPPYGHDWRADEKWVKEEAEKGAAGRFVAGLPRISDGQLLFLQHMLSRVTAPKDGGSRVAIVMNGSPLFTGDAGSGESEIRRWILENDWLEAIIALPEQLFYNTGIATYVWILTNSKDAKRKGKVQLINATEKWVPMRKSLGDKRRQISDDQIKEIKQIFLDFKETKISKIFKTTDFGFRKVTIERPLKLNFLINDERLARLKEENAFRNLAESKKKEAKQKVAEQKAGLAEQEKILAMLKTIPCKTDQPCKDRKVFEKALDMSAKAAGISLSGPVRKAIFNSLSEQDETAAVCMDKDGSPEAASNLRDTESVPLSRDITEYFKKEVLPHVPDAWINESVVDDEDGKIGKVGYEINFNRYFYEYKPPRSLGDIETEIRDVEKDIVSMLSEMAI